MFSKELENLIQATLEDGKLEENEKAALVKRAQREGVDLDELDIYINSLLQKRQRELNEKKEAIYEKYEEKKKEAIGPVCPKCGKQVPPLTLVCDCGYEFTKKKEVSSVQLLFEKINNIQLTEEGHISNDEKEKLKLEKKLEIISTFPVPNTKEDIVEFLSLAAPNSKMKGGFFGTVPKRLVVLGILVVIIIVVLCLVDPEQGEDRGLLPLGVGVWIIPGAIIAALMIDKDTLRWNKTVRVWRAKFDQVLMKGRSL